MEVIGFFVGVTVAGGISAWLTRRRETPVRRSMRKRVNKLYSAHQGRKKQEALDAKIAAAKVQAAAYRAAEAERRKASADNPTDNGPRHDFSNDHGRSHGSDHGGGIGSTPWN